MILTLVSEDLKSQKLLHTFQLNGGFISAPSADIYLGKLDYIPQFKLNENTLRLGANIGALYTQKEINAGFGANLSLRLLSFSTLNNNYSFGGIHLRVGYDWTTDSQKIAHTALVFELTQIAFNVTYGRDYHFDNNMITYGFSYTFSKPFTDPDEEI